MPRTRLVAGTAAILRSDGMTALAGHDAVGPPTGVGVLSPPDVAAVHEGSSAIERRATSS